VSIPPSFTLIVLAAPPLNVVPEFNCIVALSTVRLFDNVAVTPVKVEPSPTKDPEVDIIFPDVTISPLALMKLPLTPPTIVRAPATVISSDNLSPVTWYLQYGLYQ